MNSVICPICNSAKYKKIRIQILDNNSYDYFICKKCSFVFQKSKYNRIHYTNLFCQIPINYKEHSKNRAKYIFDFIKEYSYSEPINILDVGCGRGGVMYYLKKYLPYANIKGCSVDLGEAPIHKHLNIINNYFEDITYVHEFNIIILSHSLEHFIDLRFVMQKLHSILNEDGIIYIEVPSYNYAKIRTKEIFTPEHLSYFTKHSLKNLLLSEKFKIFKIKESKYWGNIKVVIGRSHIKKDIKYRNYMITWLLKPFINLNILCHKIILKFNLPKAND